MACKTDDLELHRLDGKEDRSPAQQTRLFRRVYDEHKRTGIKPPWVILVCPTCHDKTHAGVPRPGHTMTKDEEAQQAWDLRQAALQAGTFGEADFVRLLEKVIAGEAMTADENVDLGFLCFAYGGLNGGTPNDRVIPGPLGVCHEPGCSDPVRFRDAALHLLKHQIQHVIPEEVAKATGCTVAEAKKERRAIAKVLEEASLPG